MRYELPKTVNIRGEEIPIRYDFRVILEIMSMLQDDELSRTAIDKFERSFEHALEHILRSKEIR